MKSPLLRVETGPHWAWIILSRRDGFNTLGGEALEALEEAVRGALARPGIRCLALSGEGGSFAVGADLKELEGLDPPSARSFSRRGGALLGLLEGAPVPVVAAVDGYCLGGGLDLALAAHWRMATDRSLFGHPGSTLGIITGFGGTQRLPRLVGARRTFHWLATADRITAREAHRTGLVQEVHPPEGFTGRVRDRIRRFSALPPEAMEGLRPASSPFLSLPLP